MRSSRIGITNNPTNLFGLSKMKKMENRESVLFYTIALTQVPLLGKVALQRLCSAFGSPRAVFDAAASGRSGDGSPLSPLFVRQLRENRDAVFRFAEQELHLIRQYGIRTFLKGEASYPYRLSHCPDAPLVLYGFGQLPINSPRMLAVVGSRVATAYGQSVTQQLVAGLASYHPVVVSGLAYGVDTVAHEEALHQHLPTVAVLGHGLKTIYPASNQRCFEQMLSDGGVLSEYPYEVPPIGRNFPPRNRIIAGLSDAVVVVEAKRKSGALITANLGFSYNRDVFAFPGRSVDQLSEGCNMLIRSNKAALVLSAEDVAVSLQWDSVGTVSGRALTIPFDLSENEQKIYNLVQQLAVPDADTLAEESGFTVSELSSILLSLECKDLICSISGMKYRLK